MNNFMPVDWQIRNELISWKLQISITDTGRCWFLPLSLTWRSPFPVPRTRRGGALFSFCFHTQCALLDLGAVFESKPDDIREKQKEKIPHCQFGRTSNSGLLLHCRPWAGGMWGADIRTALCFQKAYDLLRRIEWLFQQYKHRVEFR